MQFSNPLAFFGLLAILIPILIHLFNFRRYKTVLFSNVKFLQYVYSESKKQSQLKNLIVLALRIIAITALVFVFAQPYIPEKNTVVSKNENIFVGVYVDNSFSTEALTDRIEVLQDFKNKMREVVNVYPLSTKYYLATNDLDSKHSRYLSKDELISELNALKISSHTIPVSVPYRILGEKLAQHSSSQHTVFLCSDFQKTTADLDHLKLQPDISNVYLLNSIPKNTSNIYIDSCWFETPVFKPNQNLTLWVQLGISNTNVPTNVPVKLYINGQQTAIGEAEVLPDSKTKIALSYPVKETGFQKAQLVIHDSPISFDDTYYFTYVVESKTKISIIYGKESNRFVQSLWGGDSLFETNIMSVKSINYPVLKQSELAILSDVESISNGLTVELKNFLNAGGNLLILPPYTMDVNSYKTFFNTLDIAFYSTEDTTTQKVKSYNKESVFFKNVFENSNEDISYPLVKKHFKISGGSARKENILQLQSGNDLFIAEKSGNGNVFISAVGLDDRFGETHRNALFIVALHNISILSSLKNDIAFTIGTQEAIRINAVSEEGHLLKIRSENGSFEGIPQQRNFGRETQLFLHDQINQSGFYNVSADDHLIYPLAFNYSRKESDLTCFSSEELKQIVKDKTGFKVIDTPVSYIQKEISEQIKGKTLWRYFIVLTLIALLAEVLILRFWNYKHLSAYNFRQNHQRS